MANMKHKQSQQKRSNAPQGGIGRAQPQAEKTGGFSQLSRQWDKYQ